MIDRLPLCHHDAPSLHEGIHGGKTNVRQVCTLDGRSYMKGPPNHVKPGGQRPGSAMR